jgi:hypothetical protein
MLPFSLNLLGFAFAALSMISLVAPVVGQTVVRDSNADPSPSYIYTGPKCGDTVSDTCPGKPYPGSSFTGAFCTEGQRKYESKLSPRPFETSAGRG